MLHTGIHFHARYCIQNAIRGRIYRWPVDGSTAVAPVGFGDGMLIGCLAIIRRDGLPGQQPQQFCFVPVHRHTKIVGDNLTGTKPQPVPIRSQFDAALLKGLQQVGYSHQRVSHSSLTSAMVTRDSVGGDTGGLADTTTWGQMAIRHKDLKIPAGVSPDDPFVKILDPAAGTGTFLVEVVDVIHRTMTEKWRRQNRSDSQIGESWNKYVANHLLPRMFGFELLMAPYAIAHMKIGLRLAETGYRFGTNERARIYLTNTLEPPHDFTGVFAEMVPALEHEASQASKAKELAATTVVVGNPPYSVRSANLTDHARALIEEFKYIDGKRIAEKGALQLEKNLNDDYINFIAFGLSQMRTCGLGVLGLVSNHAYIDSPTLRGVRASLLNTFSDLYILDLHGSSKRNETPPDSVSNENVVDIQQGVAVVVGSKTTRRDHSHAYHGDLWGSREEKYEWLMHNRIATSGMTKVEPEEPWYVLMPQDSERRREFRAYTSLTDVLPLSSTGIKTHRDAFAIDFDAEPIIERVAVLRSSVPNSEIEDRYGLANTYGWNLERARRLLKSRRKWKDNIIPILYRPFDVRCVYYHSDIVELPRRECMQHLLGRRNIAFLVPRHITATPFCHALVTRLVNEMKTCSHDRGTTCFPVSFVNGGEGGVRGPDRLNLSSAFLREFAEIRQGSKVDDVVHYIYAMLWAPSYRIRYGEFFLTEFPRIPLPANGDVAAKMCCLGADLVALHLMEDNYKGASWNLRRQLSAFGKASEFFPFAGVGDREVTKAGAPGKNMSNLDDGKGRVYINRTQYFDKVPEEVWNFHVGGYQVCHKWLADRKAKGGKHPRPGRVLTDDDILHYQRIVVALKETSRLMAEIDEVIESHGGWPDAFVTDPIEIDESEGAETDVEEPALPFE